MATATGYDPGFLATAVPLPSLDDSVADDAVEVAGSTVVDYTHFSLTMSRSRRFARWVAWNVDGGRLLVLDRSRERFRLDPRVPAETQVGDELYADNPLDRGHIARRSDLTWGPADEAQAANADSFFFTNITPQIEDFNQSRRDGVWGRLEDALYEQVDVDDLRISVVAGPVLGADDPTYRDVLIPREFWKVIGYVVDGRLSTRAFLLTQALDRLEALDLDEFHTWQVDLATLTGRSGVVFPDALVAGEGTEVIDALTDDPLESTDQIVW